MNIFSHNTMTYRSPKQWYLKPLFWVARCQSKNYKEQFESNVECFDLRIRFNTEGKIEFSHGVFRYNGDDFWEITAFAMQKGIPLRMTLEGNPINSSIAKFQNICYSLEKAGIKIFGCYCREDNWRVIYESSTPEPEIIHKYSSQDNCKWNDFCPWLWAKIHNKSILEEYKNTDNNVMMDFI